MSLTRRDSIVRLAVGAASTSLAKVLSAATTAAAPEHARKAAVARMARQDAGTSEPQSGGAIVLADQNLPPTLDIQATTNDFLDIIGQQVYQPLVYLDPETKEPTAGLAESWDLSDNGRTWTFTLRSGVSFHDGTPLTSAAVTASWDRLLDPATQAPRASLLGGDNLVAYEAPDETTVVVTHQEPMANFLANIARTFAMIISPTAIDEFGADLAEQMVGTGPFRLQDYEQAGHVTLERWDEFNWGPTFFQHEGPAYLDQITWLSIEEEGTRIAAIESGELDIGRLPWSQFERFNSGFPGLSVTTISNPGIPAGIYLNSQLAPLDDQRVRTALAMVIDREAIVQSPSYLGAVWVELGPLTEDMMGYDPAVSEVWPALDVEAAQALLAEAGFTAGGDGILERDGEPLILTMASSSLTLPLAQILQAQFGQIGVGLEVAPMDQAAVTAQWNSGVDHVNLGANTGNDPDVLWDVFHTGQRGHVDDPTVNDLLERGRTTVDLDERLGIYTELQTYLAEQIYTIHIYNSARNYAVADHVHDVSFNDRAGIYCYDIWVDA
jgi:peptide/nickel transport system substrate-binding protein